MLTGRNGQETAESKEGTTNVYRSAPRPSHSCAKGFPFETPVAPLRAWKANDNCRCGLRLDQVVSLRLSAGLHDRFMRPRRRLASRVGAVIRLHLETEPLVR